MRAPLSRLRLFWAICVPLILLAFFAWRSWDAHPHFHRLLGPDLVFWAWERPEDLRFLNTQKEAVAYLAASVELLANGVKVHPRMQPLHLDPHSQLVAVVRVYSHPNEPAALDEQQRHDTLETLLAATREPQVSALQIDFDARSSERLFYSRLLAELRSRLGANYPISITALASWCIGDRWIRDLPVNEAVPMLFSMGNEEPALRQYLKTHSSFPEPLCRGSVGLSTSEWLPNQVSRGTRVYVFSSTAWTPDSVKLVRSRLPGGF